MRISWKLRMAAAQHGVWTGTDLRRLLRERAGLQLSSPSVSALFTKEPTQIKLATLIALCTALQCTPNDLFEVDTTPVEASNPRQSMVKRPELKAAAAGRGRSMPPM
jgi:putative transcriptional regulator